MKTKIVNETFNADTGLTTVTLQNKYGHFTGTARCCLDDDYSMFQGERIAATRANIEFCKFRIKQEKAKIKALDEIIIDYNLETKYLDYPSFVLGYKLRKQIFLNKRNYEKNIENFKDSISILKNSIKLMDEERQKVLLRSKKNK